jgi:hypothetical protein
MMALVIVHFHKQLDFLLYAVTAPQPNDSLRGGWL